MPALQAFFCRAHNPGSFIIRRLTWSHWSHCGVIMPGGTTVIDATAPHGVRERPLADVAGYASEIAFREIEVPDPAAGYAYARSQIGTRYDYAGVIGIGLRRDWYADDAWFCSDLLEEIVYKSGRQRWVNNPKRITPQLAWMAA